MTEKVELLIREKGSEEVKGNTVTDIVRSTSVDILNPNEREILVSLLGRTYLTGHRVARL